MVRIRGFRRKSSLAKAKAQAKKPVDKSQNKAIVSLTKRLRKLEHTTLERKYLVSHDTFSFGGNGQIKSRQLMRLATGTYDGMTTSTAFGTTILQGDKAFLKYMIVDVVLSCIQTGGPDEYDSTRYQVMLLRPRKNADLDVIALQGTNALDSYQGAMTQSVAGISYPNPKLFKTIKYKHGHLGGIVTNDVPRWGDRVATRYRFYVPLNTEVAINSFTNANDVNALYPNEFQKFLILAVTADGTAADTELCEATVSTLLCYDDAGDN